LSGSTGGSDSLAPRTRRPETDAVVGLILLLQTLTVAVSGPATSPEYLPLRVAEAEGIFRDEGLAVTLKTTRAEVGAAEALTQGQVDLAATSLEAVLRFSLRVPSQRPRLVFGLTAAPPVALLAAPGLGGTVREIQNLVGLRVGVVAPGVPEHTWLNGLLRRARVRPAQIDLVSLGSRGLVTAVESGEVQAGLVHEPFVTQLVNGGQVTILADLRGPETVKRVLGVATVNAAVFTRADRQPNEQILAAFARAVLAAERQLATAHPKDLAAHLSRSVVGSTEEFERRVVTTRGMYLVNGWVSSEQVRETIGLIQAHLPLPAVVKVPRAEEMLHLEPLRRATPTRK
jgi:NitT/TauT family transport system substrate-binding protein